MRIRVDHQPLAQSIAVLADTADRIRGLLDELESEAFGLRQLWTGQAHEAYSRAQREWTECADGMQTALTSAATAAARAHARTRDAEAHVATLWS
ncbi:MULTISPECIES: WXG100 family type VII secretion target [Microbacterium]|uniref:WXG100 family type VII secretion target n=1 Tax=Microbacterium TaxID=33882 RepID=UPI0006971FAD|nr:MULTISPECIES: WXG100 family type VII secretion target [Microbacterium]AQY02822.1 WXG100 family type VII secretion target [Microbacterium foliorum]